MPDAGVRGREGTGEGADSRVSILRCTECIAHPVAAGLVPGNCTGIFCALSLLMHGGHLECNCGADPILVT